jgi:hypothetical protein
MTVIRETLQLKFVVVLNVLASTVRSPIKLNALVTSRLPTGTDII